ncbi:MAG: hypothetical protein AMXMBFR84_14660 [Candidatus Hydrogenedentota bacterium]
MSASVPNTPGLVPTGRNQIRLHAAKDCRRVYIALHGWAGSHRTFSPLLPHVPDDVQLLAPDLPGHGEAPRPKTWTVVDMMMPVLTAVDASQSKTLTAIGYCGGALYALELARLRPSTIKDLVLIDPFAYLPLCFAIFTWGLPGRIAYWSAFKTQFGRFLVNGSLRRARQKDTDLTKGFDALPASDAIAQLKVMASMKNLSRFAGVHCPITIVHSKSTLGAVKNSLPMYAGAFPRATFVELSETGHAPIKESPELLADILFHSRFQRAKDGI